MPYVLNFIQGTLYLQDDQLDRYLESGDNLYDVLRYGAATRIVEMLFDS